AQAPTPRVRIRREAARGGNLPPEALSQDSFSTPCGRGTTPSDEGRSRRPECILRPPNAYPQQRTTRTIRAISPGFCTPGPARERSPSLTAIDCDHSQLVAQALSACNER